MGLNYKPTKIKEQMKRRRPKKKKLTDEQKRTCKDANKWSNGIKKAMRSGVLGGTARQTKRKTQRN